jgi:HD-like signal output (HDOD) protein
MGGKKTAGIVLLVVGLVVLLLSLSADVIGIGGSPAFGFRQIVGTIVGAIVAVVGLVLTLKK